MFRYGAGVFSEESYLHEKTTALFFVRLCYVGSIFVPAFFFHFVNSLLKLEKNRLICSLLCISLIFLVFDFTPLLIKDVRPILSFRYYGIPGPIYPFYAVSFISIIGYSHYILIKYFKKSRRANKESNQICIICSHHWFFGRRSTTFLPNFNIEVFPFGFYFVSVLRGNHFLCNCQDTG